MRLRTSSIIIHIYIVYSAPMCFITKERCGNEAIYTQHCCMAHHYEVVHSGLYSHHRQCNVRDDPTFSCILMEDHQLGHLGRAGRVVRAGTAGRVGRGEGMT